MAKTYEDGLIEGRRNTLVECAEIADVVADDRDATAFRYEGDAAVAMYRAAERAARQIAVMIRSRSEFDE